MLLPFPFPAFLPFLQMKDKYKNFSCTAHLPESFSAYKHELPKGYDEPGDRSCDLRKSNSTVNHFISNNMWEQFKRKSQKPGMGEE